MTSNFRVPSARFELRMPDCTHFTWKEDSFPGGACFLFTQLGHEEPAEKSI
eukprot:s3808_g1.t1